MTREEAIEILKNSTMRDTLSERWKKAYTMAVRALSQEPCYDAVSIQTVKENMIKYGFNAPCMTITEFVEDLPPANIQSEHKVGEWILQPSNKEQGERDFIWWKCSECGQVIYSETEKDRREFHAFCGRCGAKMIDRDESEV